MSAEVELRNSSSRKGVELTVQFTENDPPAEPDCANGSPRSTSSWEESFQNLSRELQNICSGSGRMTPPVRPHSGSNTEELSRSCSPEMTGFGGRQQHHSGDSPLEPTSCSPLCGPLCGPSPFAVSMNNKRCSFGASALPPTRSGSRPLRVQHEETTDKLRQSLTKICFQNNSPTSSSSALATPPEISSNPRHVDVTNTAKASQLRLRESLKSGVRVRFSLSEAQCEADNVFVVVRTNDAGTRTLHVCSVVDPDKSLLIVSLPEQSKITALTCCVIDGQTLYIRERSKETMFVEFSQSDEIFLPVIRDDEAQLTLAITLRIPESFEFDDLAVKTIDDHLVIKGRHSVNADGVNSDHRLSLSSTLTLMMGLPEGTFSRTVKASLAVKECLLVISAQRSSTSRRMTCNF